MANFLLTLALPDEMERWSLTTLRDEVYRHEVYGKPGDFRIASNDHRWPSAITTGNQLVRGPVLTFGQEKELRIGFMGQPLSCPGLIKKLVK